MLLKNLRRSMSFDSKYILYGIGEIGLVVAGILIALQVDNWREGIANDKKVLNYLNIIQNDLNDQLIEIDLQIHAELDILHESEKLIKSFNDNLRFVANDQFSTSIGNINNWRTFIKINPGYEQLLATGDIGLFENQQIKHEIFAYYHQLHKVQLIIDENHGYVQSSFVPLVLSVSNHSLPNFQNDLFKKIVNKGYVPENVNQVLSDTKTSEETIQKKLSNDQVKLELFNAIKMRYRIAAVHLSYLEDLKDRTQSLKSQL